MKYAFIINPEAGNGKDSEHLMHQVSRMESSPQGKMKYYITEGVKDAEIIAEGLARQAAEENEDVTVFACGGDGTANEVLNGIHGYENAVMGVIPTGSGNDFVRCFDGRDFTDLEAQLAGEERRIDCFRYEFEGDNGTESRYCLNGINIGFDGNTAILAHHLRSLPLVNGTFSYLLSVIVNLVQKRGQNLKVTVGDEVIHNGKLLLCTASNGRFCGGGVESCPYGELDDGFAEVLIIKNVPRWKFVSLFPTYSRGEIFETEDFSKFGKYVQAPELTIEPRAGRMQFVVDGEEMMTGKIKITVENRAVRLIVPRSGQSDDGEE